MAAAAALGMLDEAVPPKKKQRPLTKTELRRVEIRTLLIAGTPLPQIAKQLEEEDPGGHREDEEGE